MALKELSFDTEKKTDDLQDLNFDGEVRAQEAVQQEQRVPRGPFASMLDVLQRGQYAVQAPLLKQVQQIKEGSILATASPFASPEQTKMFITESLKGLSGKKRVQGSDFFSELGWAPTDMKGKVASGIAGFALDVAMDPLTYASFGASTIVKAAGKKTVKLGPKTLVQFADIPIIKGEKVLKRLDMLGDAFKNTRFGKTLTKFFKNTTGNSHLDAIIEKNMSNREYLKDQAFRFGNKTNKAIKEIAKKSNAKIDDVSKNIVDIIEMGADEAFEGAGEVAGKLTTHFDDIITREWKSGLDVKKLESEQGLKYFPRITTDEARKYLKQASVGKNKVWNPMLGNALKRKTGDFTLTEFNQFMAENGLESLGGKRVQQFFMHQPAYAATVRGTRSAKATTSMDFLKEVGQTFGKNIDEAPGSYEILKLPKDIYNKIPELKDKAFDPEIAKEVSRYYSKVFNPEEINSFLKAYDTVQNTWKGWTLSLFPSYHTRNVVSNLYLNQLADVTNPKVYTTAGALQRYRKTGNVKHLGKLPKEYADDIIEKAERLDVLGSGWYGADIPKALEEMADKTITWKNVGSLNTNKNMFIRGGRAVGTMFENNARLAHFVDKVGKGFSPEEAAKSVKKYLFDYGDLSLFEKQVMKRVFPFYTFTRKNLPLQLEMLIKKPGRSLPLLEKLRKSIANGDMPEYEALPSWLKERFAMRLGNIENNVGSYVPLEGYMPSTDIVKLMRFWEVPLEMMSPLMKYPLEQAINRNIYFEQPITKADPSIFPLGEPKEFLGMEMPARVEHTLRYVRLLGEIDKLIGHKGREGQTPFQKGLRLVTGIKVYNKDMDKLRSSLDWQFKKQEIELKKQRKWAHRNGRESAVLKLNKALEEVARLRKEKISFRVNSVDTKK